eukprot:14351392-Alexandrium_andersonii.AAC.1
MEASRASCCSEFRNIRGSQQQNTAVAESIKTELTNTHQQIRHLEQRALALEPRPRGVGPEGAGAASNPAKLTGRKCGPSGLR